LAHGYGDRHEDQEADPEVGIVSGRDFNQPKETNHAEQEQNSAADEKDGAED